MNNTYLNQQFQLAQNPTPISTPTPNQTPSNQTPRPRTETPIHPPQVPPQSTPSRARQTPQQQVRQQHRRLQQQQQKQQQQQQQQQQYNVQATQQTQAQQGPAPEPDMSLQPPTGPPTAAFHASRLPPQPDLSDVLAAQVVRQEAIDASQQPEPIFHRVGDPPQAPLKGRSYFQPQYGTYNPAPTTPGQHPGHVQAYQVQHAQPTQAQQAQAQQAQQIMQLAQASQYSPGPTPQGTPNTGTRQASIRPAQQHRQDQDADPSSQLHEESMQDLQEEVYDQEQDDDDDQDMQDGNNDQGGGGDADGDNTENTGFNTDPSGPQHLAPLMLPITPLQLPAIRPTLKLGPYDTREEAMNTVQEYAIVQGYVLVLTGCAKQKTPAGKYTGESQVVRVDLMCDRGGICKNSGTGKRKRPTHKIGCPARIKLVCKKRQASKWFIEIRCEEHNHDLDPSKMHTIAAYRRWRRVQAGGPSIEPLKERHERSRKPKVMPPVPPPKFHQVGGLNSQPPANPTSPLHMAALKGQCKIIDILLNKGADINNLDQTGRTPLHCAVEGERMDAVTKLMERGADVTAKDVKGISALAMAVEKGMEDAVVMFIEAGADPNV